MKYKEFKDHFYKRLVNEYGFKKEDKIYRYRNDEILITFVIEKSSYSNSVSSFGFGISPLEILKNWNTPDPLDLCDSVFKFPLSGGGYIELDQLTDFKEYDKKIDDFFEEEFPKLLTVQSLKKLVKLGELPVRDYVKEFWNIK